MVKEFISACCRMVLSGSVKWVQYVLIVLNFLVMAAGIASVGVGVWSVTTKYGSDNLSELTDSQIFRVLSILAIVGGVCNVIIGIFGVRCIHGETKRLMIYHFIAMVLMFLFFVIVTALGFVSKANSLEEKISKQMAKTLTEKYNVGSGNEEITTEWDTMQQALECCGVEGNVSEGRSWILWQSSRWFRNQNPKFMYVPESCCNKKYFMFKCGIFREMTGEAAERSYSSFIDTHPALFTTGCLSKIKDKVQTMFRYIAGGLIGILTLMFLCGLFSFTLVVIIVKRNKHEQGEFT